jgi:hypothetical protein
MVNRDLRMSEQEFLALKTAEATRLIEVRFHALRACGCEGEAAALVAVHPEVSVREAADLLERGCKPRTALRILL